MSLQAWHFSSWLQLDSFPHFKGTKLAFSSICGALLHFWSPSFRQPWESCSLWAAACLKLKTADKILACCSIRNSLCLKKSVQGRHQHFICGSSVVTCGTVSIIYTALRGLIIILQSFTFILVLSKDNYSDNYLGQAAQELFLMLFSWYTALRVISRTQQPSATIGFRLLPRKPGYKFPWINASAVNPTMVSSRQL